MIVVDGKELNLSAPQTDNEKMVSEWIKSHRNDKPVIIKNPNPLTADKILYKPPLSFDVSGTRLNPDTGQNEKWIYCKRAVINNKNGFKTYPPERFSIKIEEKLSYQGNAELLFFLTNSSIVGLSQFGLIVENKEEEAKLKLTKVSAEYEVGSWIMNKLPENEVVQYAWRWNLQDIEEKTDSELRMELFELIKSFETARDKKRGYEAFINEMKNTSNVVKIGSYFNKSVKDKVVGFNKLNWNCYYIGTTDIICQIPPARFNVDKEEYVIQYLVSNEKEQKEFLNAISGGVDEMAFIGGDYKMIKNAAKLRKWAMDNLGEDIGLKSIDEGCKIIDGLIALKKPQEVPAE
jgi:hypothetical protein